MGGGGHWGFETRGGASGSGLGVCVVCARPQPEPCPAWLYSRPCQPARHALFRGFQVDRLRGEPPQAQGGGRQGRRSLFSWFVHALTSAPGSAGSWRHHVPWPFQSPLPPDPSCLPCSPSCSHHLLPALHGLSLHSGTFVRFFFFPSLLLARGREEAASSACQVETRGIKWPFSPFLPQRVGVSHVSSPAHLVSTAQLPKPRMRLKATGPGVGDRPKRPQSRQRPGPRCSQAWEGEASALRCSSLFFLFHQLSLRLDRTRQLEMLTSAFKTENPTETAVQRSPSQSESRFRDGAEAWPPPG